jgi:hypothetical protein
LFLLVIFILDIYPPVKQVFANDTLNYEYLRDLLCGFRRSSSSGDSTNRLLANKPPLMKKNSAGGMMSGGSQGSATPVASPLPRYLWLRLALFEKQLAKIIDHLVQNSRWARIVFCGNIAVYEYIIFKA